MKAHSPKGLRAGAPKRRGATRCGILVAVTAGQALSACAMTRTELMEQARSARHGEAVTSGADAGDVRETLPVPVPPGVEGSAIRAWKADDAAAWMSLEEATAQAERKLEGTAEKAAEREVSPDSAAEAQRLYARGRLAAMDRRSLAAVVDLQKAHELDPTSPEVLRELARAYELERQPGKARDAYVKLLHLSPDDQEVLFRLGVFQEGSGNFSAAVAYLGRLERLADGGSVDAGALMTARWSLGTSLARLGHDAAFVTVTRRMLASADDLADVSGLSPRLSALYRQRAAMWRAVGDADVRLGRLVDAGQAYERSKHMPGADGPGLAARQAYVALRQGNGQRAQDVVLTALEESTSDRVAKLASYVGRHAHDAARLREGVAGKFAADPNSGALALAAASLARGDDRVGILREYVVRSPDDAGATRQLLMWLAEDDAGTAVRFAVDLSKPRPAALAELCDAMSSSAARPTELIRAVRALSPSPTATRLEARLQATMGGLGPAWQTCDAGLERWPEDAGLVWEMYELAGLLGERELVSQLAQGAGSKLDDAQSWRIRARAHAAVGDIAKSIEAAEAGVARDSQTIEVLNDAARCYAALAQHALSTKQADVDFVPLAGVRPEPGDAAPATNVPQAAIIAATRACELARQSLAIRNENDAAIEVLVAMVGPGGPLEDAAEVRELVRRSSAHEGESGLIRRLLAQEMVSQQQFEPAIERLIDLYSADPTDIASVRLAVKAWQQWGKLERADGWLSEQLEQRPGNPVLLEQWALVRSAMHRGEQAIERIEGMYAHDDLHYSAARLLEALYETVGRTDDRRALMLARLNGQPQAAGREVELARVKSEMGDAAGALQHLQWVQAHASGASRSHLESAIIACGKVPGDEGTRERCALGLVLGTVKSYPESGLKVYGRGMLAVSRLKHDEQEVIDLVEQALEKSTGGAGFGLPSVLAWRDLAQQLVDGRMPGLAARVISHRTMMHAAKLDPRGLGLLVSIVMAASAAANIEEPGSTRVVVDLVGDLEERGVLSRLQLAGDEIRNGGLLYTASTISSLIGDAQGAETLMQEILRAHPEAAMVKNNLGYLMLDRGDQEARMISLIEEAGTAMPDDPSIADTIGWLRYKQGMFSDQQAKDNAVYWLRKAIDTAQDPPAEVHDHLGDTLWRVGDHEQAVMSWRRALKILEDPDLRQQIQSAYRRLQTQSWGVLVVDPAVMYDRQYGEIERRLRAKLEAADAGGLPPIASTFSDSAGRTD